MKIARLARSFRLKTSSVKLMERLAKKLGLNRTATIELALRTLDEQHQAKH